MHGKVLVNGREQAHDVQDEHGVELGVDREYAHYKEKVCDKGQVHGVVQPGHEVQILGILIRGHPRKIQDLLMKREAESD